MRQLIHATVTTGNDVDNSFTVSTGGMSFEHYVDYINSLRYVGGAGWSFEKMYGDVVSRGVWKGVPYVVTLASNGLRRTLVPVDGSWEWSYGYRDCPHGTFEGAKEVRRLLAGYTAKVPYRDPDHAPLFN